MPRRPPTGGTVARETEALRVSKTLMRGLTLLETIDAHGPITIMELARLSGSDKSIVSRTVGALEREGWVVRMSGKIELGPRAALLGHSSPAGDAVRRAEPLVHAVAGVTGLLTQAYALVGTRAVVMAAANGRGPSTPVGLGSGIPLFATAAGKVIAAQLESAELDRRLPAEPYPDPAPEIARLAGFPPVAGALRVAPEETLASSGSVASTRAELEAQLEQVRRQGLATDHGEFHPQLGCIAMPWSQPGVPAALACMGSPGELATIRGVVQGALGAATVTGAKPEDVVAGAAHALAAV
jgi:DNA-binding IclR family transcriptional regulator